MDYYGHAMINKRRRVRSRVIPIKKGRTSPASVVEPDLIHDEQDKGTNGYASDGSASFTRLGQRNTPSQRGQDGHHNPPSNRRRRPLTKEEEKRNEAARTITALQVKDDASYRRNLSVLRDTLRSHWRDQDEAKFALWRAKVCVWSAQIASQFGVPHEIVDVSLSYFDRYCYERLIVVPARGAVERIFGPGRDKMQDDDDAAMTPHPCTIPSLESIRQDIFYASLVSMYLALKLYQDAETSWRFHYHILANPMVKNEDLLAMEMDMLSHLRFKVHPPTKGEYVRNLVEATGSFPGSLVPATYKDDVVQRAHRYEALYTVNNMEYLLPYAPSSMVVATASILNALEDVSAALVCMGRDPLYVPQDDDVTSRSGGGGFFAPSSPASASAAAASAPKALVLDEEFFAEAAPEEYAAVKALREKLRELGDVVANSDGGNKYAERPTASSGAHPRPQSYQV